MPSEAKILGALYFLARLRFHTKRKEGGPKRPSSQHEQTEWYGAIDRYQKANGSDDTSKDNSLDIQEGFWSVEKFVDCLLFLVVTHDFLPYR
jgi:hypothetical protein